MPVLAQICTYLKANNLDIYREAEVFSGMGGINKIHKEERKGLMQCLGITFNLIHLRTFDNELIEPRKIGVLPISSYTIIVMIGEKVVLTLKPEQ